MKKKYLIWILGLLALFIVLDNHNAIRSLFLKDTPKDALLPVPLSSILNNPRL